MPWSEDNYPASMKNLTEEVRQKAIEIANALCKEESYGEQRAIAIATAQAEKWAKHRDKPIRREGAQGSTGHAITKDDPEADQAIHVIPAPDGDGWIAQQTMQQLAQGHSKDDVLNKARQKAKSQGVSLCIHDEKGDLEAEEDDS